MRILLKSQRRKKKKKKCEAGSGGNWGSSKNLEDKPAAASKAASLSMKAGGSVQVP